jgi:2-polyprenyl-6-methoxyphenol hydroxylase-like FAD-dependent oxidoreductase
MPEVIIVGGGIAGSALAIQLGRRGVSVELLERGRFPKEKACGEGLMPAGVAALGRLGLASQVHGAPFQGIRYHFGGEIAGGRFPKIAGLPVAGHGQRRRELDRALFDEALQTPNVSACTGVRVEGPLVENRRVTGVIVGGEARRAGLVVAADGSNSRLRHALGLDVPTRRKRIGVRAHFRLAGSAPQQEWVDVFLGEGHELYVTPLPNRELLVAALAEADAMRSRIEKTFHRWCQAQPKLAARLEGAEQVSDLLAYAPLSGRARRGWFPGLILLGDAAGSTDPITGGGMTQGLLAAELLAQYVTCAREDSAWLAEFDRERNAMLRDYRRLTAMMLWLALHPRLMRSVFRALRFSPAFFSHLLGVSGGVRRLWGGEQRYRSNAALACPSPWTGPLEQKETKA